MRLVVAGSPAAAVPTLRRLAASDHEIAAVLTRPTTPQGRKRVLTPTPVAQVASQLGVGWATIMAAVIEYGLPLVDDPARLGGVTTLGVDETAFGGAGPRRSTTFVTGVVDLSDVDGLTDRIREAAGGPVDVVIDPVGGDAATAALLALAENGRFVHLGASGGPTATFSSAALRSGSHSILGYTNNALTAAQKAEALGAVLEHRCTVTYETVGLDDVADAWSRAGATPDGRLVVVP